MTFTLDPEALLDYVFDWSLWLSAGETIISATVTADPGITIGDVVTADGKVTVWLSGGTVNTRYKVYCSIVTSDSREDTRHMTISVRPR
jgi:hypothetical protein